MVSAQFFFVHKIISWGEGGGEGAEGIQHSQKIGHKIQYKELLFFNVSGILKWPLLNLTHLHDIQDPPASFMNTQHISLCIFSY